MNEDKNGMQSGLLQMRGDRLKPAVQKTTVRRKLWMDWRNPVEFMLSAGNDHIPLQLVTNERSHRFC